MGCTFVNLPIPLSHLSPIYPMLHLPHILKKVIISALTCLLDLLVHFPFQTWSFRNMFHFLDIWYRCHFSRVRDDIYESHFLNFLKKRPYLAVGTSMTYSRMLVSAFPSELVDTHLYCPASPWVKLLMTSFMVTRYRSTISSTWYFVLVGERDGNSV